MQDMYAFGMYLNQFHLTINLTPNHSYSHINFLDTTIYIKNGTIQTSLYQKPTGRPAYFRLRYNRICSNLDDRNKHLHSLRKTFINQRYHPQVIDDQIHRATQIPRDTLLDYKEKTENNRVTIVVTYNPQLKHSRNYLSSYRQPPNLRKMIVRSALPKTTKAGIFPCNSYRCKTCKYILCKDQVAIPNTQKVYTILDHYSCASSNVAYMITCTRWQGAIYIGETGQKLCTRMNHHRHKINTKSCDTPVLILKWNFINERERKIYEFKCMEIFNTLRQGLNLGSGFMSHYVT
ncbi:hypothetical protein XELAEV_18022800mg [Xenopus laevis]|uniref:GIY-YIG domain-containing protein n=1 Tax=Xenopus laevis TaxID=8355 RepID=A0A974D5Q2_XENLA|nr:hypothetical protein XELAEV_18022800mg [Xenopus laevis]